MPLSAFQTVTAHKILERDPREEIRRASELLDEGGKGYIDREDLRRVARERGETGLEEDRTDADAPTFWSAVLLVDNAPPAEPLCWQGTVLCGGHRTIPIYILRRHSAETTAQPPPRTERLLYGHLRLPHADCHQRYVFLSDNRLIP